jgi:3-methyladenine DNA glycosylase AlkC
MGHSSIRPKVRRRKVAALAAYSRKFTVRNNTIHKLGLNSKNVVVMFKEIPTARFDTPIFGKMFEIDKDGHYHLIEREFDPTPMLLNHKQPKRLMKYNRIDKDGNQRNDFVKFFPNYPYNLPKMNKQEYMEKLVQHKLAKWEKKNPKPQQDLFDKVEDWEQRRFLAEQRFRDFVVSVYDPLTLIGRFVLGAGNSATYQEKKIAEIKDINGEGHMVNHLSKNSKLMKKAQKITNHTKNKYPSLVACNLKDHKKQHGRIILPQAA